MEQLQEDPCAVNTSALRWAFVWAFVVIVGGFYLTCVLSRIDSALYAKKGLLLDYDAYTDNRRTFTSLPSESVDSRRYPTLTAAEE